MFFLETERDKNKPKEQLFEMGSNDAVTIAHRRNSLGGKNVNWSRSVDHCLWIVYRWEFLTCTMAIDKFFNGQPTQLKLSMCHHKVMFLVSEIYAYMLVQTHSLTYFVFACWPSTTTKRLKWDRKWKIKNFNS